MKIDEAAAAEIEKLYADLSIPVAEIARRFGCAPSTLSRYARIRGWPGRWERLGYAPRRRAVATRMAKATLMERLSAAATKQLEQMEQGMQDGSITASDFERLAKSVGSMIGSMEKVAAVRDDDKREGKPGAGQPGAAADAVRIRREIAERLERLAQDRLARGGSGKSE